MVGPKRVMTTAHGVAGTDEVSVEVDGTKYNGQVVSFDPNMDISILAIPDLPTAPLMFSEAPAVSGADAAALGFPHGGAYEAKPVRVRGVIKLQKRPDIFRTGTVTREVYALRGGVQQREFRWPHRRPGRSGARRRLRGGAGRPTPVSR